MSAVVTQRWSLACGQHGGHSVVTLMSIAGAGLLFMAVSWAAWIDL